MGENIQRLKSCITDLRNKIESAEERTRRAKKVLKLKEQRFEVRCGDVSLTRSKLALAKEKLQKTYELLEEKHEQLEEVDELLHTNTVIWKELTDNETQNFKKTLALEIALNKTRAKAVEYESKIKDFQTKAQVLAREIQIANISEMKAKRKYTDLTSRIITRKGLLMRLQVKEEQFHEREKDFIDKHHFFDEKIKEATTRAEAAERRTSLLEGKVSKLRQELHQQTSNTKKIFVLKRGLEQLSLEY